MLLVQINAAIASLLYEFLNIMTIVLVFACLL